MELWVKTVMVGKQTTTLAGNELITSEFEDDALILIGKDSLYLKRHIFRAFRELDAVRAGMDPLRHTRPENR